MKYIKGFSYKENGNIPPTSTLKQGNIMIALLLFTSVAVIVGGAASAIAVSNIQSSSAVTVSNEALRIAESGAEDAIKKIQRDPTYTGSYTAAPSNGTSSVTITGSGTVTITSQNNSSSPLSRYPRKVQVIGTMTQNVFAVTSFREIP